MFTSKNQYHRPFTMAARIVVAASVASVVTVSALVQAQEPQGTKLLSVRFEPRVVNKVDVGDFHFIPGQPAPIHTHAAPVFGYVSKGAIYYQVEGQKPQLLKTGDAFYEPVGPNILHFDNASKTKEAIFTDFNLQRTGEPFIVFPKPLTAKIDRRAFPTATLDGSTVNRVDVYANLLKPAGKLAATNAKETNMFYVAEGAVRLQFRGEKATEYATGKTFFEPKGKVVESLTNISKTKRAKLIRFRLINAE